MKTLQRSVLTTRTIINEMIVTQNELKEEIDNLKSTTQCEHCEKRQAASQARTIMAVAGQTEDDHIDAIIQGRKRKALWPLRHSTLRCFGTLDDLIKVRMHRSDRYQHVPIKIPKTEKNKAGDKACVLCSDSKVKRKTTWICSTCEVPLCNRVLLGQDGGSKSHHDLWHSAQNLIEEHEKCHQMLLDSRENNKKRHKTDATDAAADESTDQVKDEITV